MSSKENKPIAVGDLCLVTAQDNYGLKPGQYKLRTALHPEKDYTKEYARVTKPENRFEGYWHSASNMKTIIHGPDFFR